MAKGQFFTIPSGVPFLPQLVRGIKAQLGRDAIRHATIFLPTRRATLALRDVFLREDEQAGKAVRLLPRIRTLADVDEDELMLSGDAGLALAVAGLPPAITPMRRAFLLMKLVRARDPSILPQHAFLLAGELGRLIDQSLIENADLAKLADLVPEDFARHWQDIRSFLQIVHQHWPLILAEEGCIDAVDRRQRMVRLLADHWRANPPAHPVIAAGSTGSQPVIGDLLQVIAGLPQGAVILPGLDTYLEEEAWRELEPTHPQFLMARLLSKAGIAREDVGMWGGAAGMGRGKLFSEVMRPASVADRWRHMRHEKEEAVWCGMQRIDARNEHQEAYAAALMLRHCVSETSSTAALVTPDRTVAARVAAILRRWGIIIDDSAGTPLSLTPAGAYLALLLDVADQDAPPAALMAFLKHPFTGCGYVRAACLDAARDLERSFFRDRMCGSGMRNWLRLAALEKEPTEAHAFLKRIAGILAPFEKTTVRSFAEWLDVLRDVAEGALAEKDRIWQGPEGEALALLLEELASTDFECGFYEAAEIIKTALANQVVRIPYGQHPRLAILGLLEARLLSYDHIILAGLNEGSWPQLHSPDPWMSRAMRSAVDLAPPDQRVGQMAHDFVQLASAPDVTLLRSERAGGAPSQPSRWLLRLDAVLRLLGAEKALLPTESWLEWSANLDRPDDLLPCAAPAVKLSKRYLPERLSVSDIELWVRDPYAFYAKKVLGLYALEPLNARFGAAERGMALHATLHQLARLYPAAWPVAAQDDFCRLMRDNMRAHGAADDDIALIETRLPSLAQGYWQFENERRQLYANRYTEVRGNWPLEFTGYKTALTARADRIDAGSSLAIIDYKTGAVPTKEQVKAGFKPQLPLEALLALEGAFADVNAADVAELAHVAFEEKTGAIKLKSTDIGMNELETIHRPGFLAFIAAFLQEDARFHAVPRPQRLAPAQDYARLARVAEWSKGALVQEDSEA